MRPLNTIELENKIDLDSSDIFYSESVHAQDKISHFFTFLHSQPISKRILERIDEDFSKIKNGMPAPSNIPPSRRPAVDHRVIKAVKENIKDKQDQGALGYFVIQELFDVEQKYEYHYLDSPSIWYGGGMATFDESFSWFNEKFFKPFVELLKWYIYESQVKSEKDYYSRSEIAAINEKLDEILATQTASTRVIFEQIEEEIKELKELILFLSKKNWVEVFKGKLGDVAFAEILTNDNAKSLFNYISENISFLT